MSTKMEEDIKRWTAKRKSTLVLDIIHGKTTVVEVSRAYDLSPSEVEGWVDDGKRGMENALRANPLDLKEQYERQIKDLQEAYGEGMLELCARKTCSPCWARTTNDRDVRQGLQADGITVSISKLCRWFEVPRRTVYYRSASGHAFRPCRRWPLRRPNAGRPTCAASGRAATVGRPWRS